MFAGRIDIIDNHGGCAVVWHQMKDLSEKSIQGIQIHAETIVKALGDDWMIYSNTDDGYIKIGLTNPQTEDAKKMLGMDVPLAPTMADTWLTTVEIETEYGLPTGSVRRDIHRKKFANNELKKVGRDWTIRMDAANRLYKKSKNIVGYCNPTDPYM
jgi:hypothetical protein